MKTRDLTRLGIPRGPSIGVARAAITAAREAGCGELGIIGDLRRVAAEPGQFVDDPIWGELARAMVQVPPAARPRTPRQGSAPYRIWGSGFEDTALQQMANACSLPIALAGALMPDAHQGYGLPIGGVLATDDAVIPYAVGVDIACRMKMTVLDLPLHVLERRQAKLASVLERETRFGVGATFHERRQHEVMDRDWSVSRVTERLKDKAWSQLGTSGSGNHFVEFGALEVWNAELGLEPGEYLALLSHSGSRGTGNEVARHFSELARSFHPELPRELAHLAWLDLASHSGQEYWAAMELMGLYAAANHALIHQHVVRALGCGVLLDVENHHNFAWRERHRLPDGTQREVVVHRKGATPAGRGTLGIIPGSMATPGYVVRGRGEPTSLDSAAHGAGRRMSRARAKQVYSWEDAKRVLRAARVTLLSAGLDELPMAYKDIDAVMAAQTDLVEPLARFSPRLVKMAPGGEPPED
ncbi:MAG: RtcB family protein [Thermoanaerobaculaceae bacterium]|nr:RtcB family protein [Thermoanaerobaculaceae bacterium]MDI9622375.1 RtcB family protein [Acidobacteriota bacterium]NLH11131.1 RtcB family protein [Holophagae bacterium]HPW54276.1 RtcB family protein [Thermoanaerobaculaceae bacterium]